MYRVEFSDGRVLDGLSALGCMALTYPGRLEWKLPPVIQGVSVFCDDDEDTAELAGKHDLLMNAGQFSGTCHDEDGTEHEYTNLLFRYPGEHELDMVKLKGDVVFLSMMLGVDLDG